MTTDDNQGSVREPRAVAVLLELILVLGVITAILVVASAVVLNLPAPSGD